MNNTHYPDMLCDHMPLEDVRKISGISLSYVREAAYGDRITVTGAKREDGYYFRTFNEAGEVCLEAQIQITQR
jgi:acyl-ACP thioesterase